MAQERIGNKAVGSLVKIREGDALAEYRIVHQGKPSSLYDASCDGCGRRCWKTASGTPLR